MKPELFNVVVISSALLVGACALPQKQTNARFDFSKIRRISVMPFEGQGGSAATDEFVRALVGAGIDVTDAHHPGDAILKGNVTDYKANNQLTVFLGNTTLMTPGGQSVVADNPIVSQGGAQATPETSTLGAHNPQVLSVIASVGINVTLMDPGTKNGVWAGSASYEGLELQATLQTVVHSLALSLRHVLPGRKVAS